MKNEQEERTKENENGEITSTCLAVAATDPDVPELRQPLQQVLELVVQHLLQPNQIRSDMHKVDGNTGRGCCHACK